MIQKVFFSKDAILHLPIIDVNPEEMWFVKVLVNGKQVFEFLAGLTVGEPDYYTPLYLCEWKGKEIMLACDDANVPNGLFDGIAVGGKIEERTDLYPDMYCEPGRQRVHFSTRRGWINDPNGLVYCGGKFHLSYQHDPFCPNHNSINVSWGLATSEDGVHFQEFPDAVRPDGVERTVASGSAIVDVDNVSGFGPDTVLGAYTDYWVKGYKGRQGFKVRGQMVGYSTDGGYSFKPIADKPVIPIAPNSGWRDPKILRTEPGSLCIGVYETYEGKNCVSFYSSTDCRNWTFRSRAMDLFECPDLFPLPVAETGEELWVLYGAGGQYRVGKFENYVFTPLQADNGAENGGYLDYGNATYAGQTWNSHPDKTCRYHISWVRDADAVQHWYYNPSYNYGLPFCQSMSVQCKLTLHMTSRGYRLFREPTGAFASLRHVGRNAPVLFNDENGMRQARIATPLVGDCELTFSAEKPYTVKMGENCGFTYNPADHTICFINGKSYVLDGDILSLRVITDVRTVEFFVNKEISATYANGECVKALIVLGEDVTGIGTRYALDSIWKTKN